MCQNAVVFYSFYLHVFIDGWLQLCPVHFTSLCCKLFSYSVVVGRPSHARMTVAKHIVIRPSYKMYCERRTISFLTKTEGENKVIKEKMRKYRKTYMRI